MSNYNLILEHKTSYHDYSLFFKFIEKFEPSGYVGIDRNDPLVLELEEMTEVNNQYFFLGDLFESKFLFVSKRSIEVIGIEADELTPYHGVEAVHPEEVRRNTTGWGKLINQGNELFSAKGGSSLLSVNMKMRNPKGKYTEMLYQDFMFYSESSHNTVYVLQVHTNLEGFKLNKSGLHYYAGNDIENFRYPDDKLLSLGYFFTKREFEILKLIESGLTNADIADNLCISIFTINNHRANILAKSGKSHISDVILELHETGY